MRKSLFILVVLSLLLALTACTGSTEKDAEIVDEIVEEADEPAPTDPPATPEPTATEEMVMLPVSMVSAPLGEDFNAYKSSLPGFAPLEFEESELPAPPGSVTANWFTSGGYYVVAYYGLDLENAGPLCPGNSILSGGTWVHVSNAPTEDGACEGFPTLTDDPDVGPIDCHGVLFYRTAIPSDLQGTLFGTIEMLDADGNLVGITSQAESTPEMLEIDLEATCK